MHVAIPPIYPRLAAVSIDQNSTRYMKLSEETNRWDCVKSAESWSDSKSCKDHKSLRTIALIFGSMSFRYFRIYIRIVTLVITVVSILLIASAVIIFSRAKTNSDDLQHIHPKANTVNIQPCIVFISLGSLNTFLSLALLTLSAFSSKVRSIFSHSIPYEYFHKYCEDLPVKCLIFIILNSNEHASSSVLLQPHQKK